jgi:hypothetical protein
MNNSVIRTVVGLMAVVLTTTAWGFEVGRAKTEAEILLPNPITPAIQLNFKAELFNDGFTELPNEDVVVTWLPPSPIVPPSPIKILIPAGCFIPNGVFHVGDFRSCGVSMTVDFGRGPTALSIMEFEASLKPHRDGSASFTVETRFADNGREAAILGILGGGAVEIAIGAEMATALPAAVETLSAPPSPI